jgi:hypothetical protein
MDEDDLTDADVRATILNGRVAKTLTDDPRGERFVVRGLPRGREAQAEGYAASCLRAGCVSSPCIARRK